MEQLAETIEANVRNLEKDLAIGRKSDMKEARRWADALGAGKVFFYNTREVDIGLKDIDWTGSHVAHQEWPAQLNRFYWLRHLAALYDYLEQ